MANSWRGQNTVAEGTATSANVVVRVGPPEKNGTRRKVQCSSPFVVWIRTSNPPVNGLAQVFPAFLKRTMPAEATFENILVATDFSEASEAALTYGPRARPRAWKHLACVARRRECCGGRDWSWRTACFVSRHGGFRRHRVRPEAGDVIVVPEARESQLVCRTCWRRGRRPACPSRPCRGDS